MQKLLTLAVPTYNMEAYLSRCLDSILCDNMDYIEVIVVNDGSKDKSSEIAHDYMDKYPSVISVIDKANGNYGSCVNKALGVATGKYFRMLDADDWCNTEALNQMVVCLKNTDSDLVVTIAEDRLSDGTLIGRLSAPESVHRDQIYAIEDFDTIALRFNDFYCSHILTYKTEILRKVGLKLETGISYTDNEYVFFPLDRIQTIVCFDLPVYQYFVGRPGQTTESAIRLKSVDQLFRVFEKMFIYYKNCDSMGSARSNQQLVIAEVARWIYSVCFAGKGSDLQLQYIWMLENKLKDEPVIYNRVNGLIVRYGVDVLAYYRETGRYLTHPLMRMKLLYNRVGRKLKKLITI